MNTLLSGRVVIALVWIHCQDLLMHSSLTKGEEEFNMEDKLFVLTVHQLQGYSKGTPNISHCEAGWPRTHSTLARQFNYTSARDAQSLDGQYSHIATLFNMKAHPTMPSARDNSNARDTPTLAETLAGQPNQGHTVPCRPMLPPPPPRPGTRTGTPSPLQANAPTHLLPRPGTHSLLPKHPQPLRNVSFSDSSLKIQ